MDALSRIHSSLYFLIILLIPSLSVAQTLPNIGQTIRQQQLDIKKEQDTLQQEKQQRELDNDFQQLAPKLKEQAPLVPEGPCFIIQTISFAGVNGLKESALEKVKEITQPYIGRCMHLAEMSDIVNSVNNYFLNKGLVTTRAFLPEQSLQEGELLIRVIVGNVQSLQSDTLTPRNLSWAFPVELGEPLNLRDIEQGLDQINRLASNRSTIKLLPGDLPGESIVQVNNTKGNPYYARFSVDGTSIQQGDDYRGRIDLFAEDLGGINDMLIINYNESLAERNRALSRGVGFDYSFPWHYNLFSFNGNHFEYKNIVEGENQNFDVTGDNTNLSLLANHTLFRNRSIKLDIASSLTTKDINNYIEDTRIDVSSRQLSILKAEVKHKQYVWSDTTAFVNLSIEKGLDILGADDDGSTQYPNKAQFLKYGMYSHISKPLALNTLGIWHIAASGQYQYTRDRLPSSEQILVSSSSQMTGYGPLNLTGNVGGWLRCDLDTPYFISGETSGFSVNSRFSIMKGWVPHNSIQTYIYGQASAAELSFMVHGYGISMRLMVGKTLESSSNIIGKPDNPEFGLTLAYNTF